MNKFSQIYVYVVGVSLKKKNKYLRVVFLQDKETVHNAFFDRNFKKEKNEGNLF